MIFQELESKPAASLLGPWYFHCPKDARRCLSLSLWSCQLTCFTTIANHKRHTLKKMGHEQDASANPRAVSSNFQFSEHCQVCQHQLFYMCCTGGNTIRCGAGSSLGKRNLANKSWWLKSTTFWITELFSFVFQWVII